MNNEQDDTGYSYTPGEGLRLGSRFSRLPALMRAGAPDPRTARPHTKQGGTAETARPATAARVAKAIKVDPARAAIRAERERITDVFASEHVKGRYQTAVTLLVDTNLSADSITRILARAPYSAANEREHFEARKCGAEARAQAAKPNHGWGEIHAKLAKLRGN